jgi:hypothetical protein
MLKHQFLVFIMRFVLSLTWWRGVSGQGNGGVTQAIDSYTVRVNRSAKFEVGKLTELRVVWVVRTN